MDFPLYGNSNAYLLPCTCFMISSFVHVHVCLIGNVCAEYFDAPLNLSHVYSMCTKISGYATDLLFYLSKVLVLNIISLDLCFSEIYFKPLRFYFYTILLHLFRYSFYISRPLCKKVLTYYVIKIENKVSNQIRKQFIKTTAIRYFVDLCQMRRQCGCFQLW
jgi:hypothetical protein